MNPLTEWAKFIKGRWTEPRDHYSRVSWAVRVQKGAQNLLLAQLAKREGVKVSFLGLCDLGRGRQDVGSFGRASDLSKVREAFTLFFVIVHHCY